MGLVTPIPVIRGLGLAHAMMTKGRTRVTHSTLGAVNVMKNPGLKELSTKSLKRLESPLSLISIRLQLVTKKIKDQVPAFLRLVARFQTI